MTRCAEGCKNLLFPGDTCEDCERENAHLMRRLDQMAEVRGHSPDIEYFPGRGYRVGVWPTKPKGSLRELGYATTLGGAVRMLLAWQVKP